MTASCGSLNAPANLCKQLVPQTQFKLTDMDRDGALGFVHLIGGTRKAARLDDGEERSELVAIKHGAIQIFDGTDETTSLDGRTPSAQ